MHVPHSHTLSRAHTHSAQARVFTQQVVTHMASLNDRPIIMPLSNPTHLSECTAQEAWDWTKGMCMCILGGGGGVCSQATLLPPLPFLPCPLPLVLLPPPLPILAPLLFLFSHPSTSSTGTVLYTTLVCVYTCLPTFMTHTHSHIHTYMPMYIHTCICIYIHAYVYTYMPMYIHTCLCIYIFMPMYIHIHAYVYTYTCLCIYIYMYAYVCMYACA
jgi:hypothetical protein